MGSGHQQLGGGLTGHPKLTSGGQCGWGLSGVNGARKALAESCSNAHAPG